MTNKDNKYKGIMHRAFDFEADGIRVVDEEKRIVDLSFSSETPVKRWGVYEVLSHKSDAVLLDRLNKSGCLLFNHDRNIVLGKILKAKVEGKRGVARVQFDDDEQSLFYWNKVQSGTLRNTSVGYATHEVKREITGKDANVKVTETLTKWEPLEISLVTIPADYSVGVGRELTDEPRYISGGTAELNARQLQLNQNYISCEKEE